MATNDILPFATDPGANVQSQIDYAADSTTATGFVTGVAGSAKLNKVWRQASFIAAGIAGVLEARGYDVLDDGDLPTLITNLSNGLGGGGIVVDSITALRALLNTGNPNAFVTGYYEAFDGGGGMYTLDPTDTTSSDNGGTIIVATDGGRWKMNFIGAMRVSVRQFGAVGDNTTDDYTAFANAAALGIGIYVPGGYTYKLISAQLIISSSRTAFYTDDGRSAIINLAYAGAGACILVNGGVEGAIFRGIELFSGSSSNSMMQIQQINAQFVFDIGYFNGGGTQLTITSASPSTGGSYGIHLDKCEFYNAGVVALNISPQGVGFAQAIYITGGEFFGNIRHMFLSSGSGIYVTHYRCERIATLVGAQTAIHIDTTNKMSLSYGYLEDNNNVAVIDCGSSCNNVDVTHTYYTINDTGTNTSLKAFYSSQSGNTHLNFSNNFISAGGTLGNVVDFADATNITCKNNTLQITTAAIGINSTARADLTDIDDNNPGSSTYTTGFYTSGIVSKSAREAAGFIRVNVGTGATSNAFNLGYSKTAVGQYSFTFTQAVKHANYHVSISALGQNGASNVCLPTVDVNSQTTSGFTVYMQATGTGTGAVADATHLTVAVIGVAINNNFN